MTQNSPARSQRQSEHYRKLTPGASTTRDTDERLGPAQDSSMQKQQAYLKETQGRLEKKQAPKSSFPTGLPKSKTETEEFLARPYQQVPFPYWEDNTDQHRTPMAFPLTELANFNTESKSGNDARKLLDLQTRLTIAPILALDANVTWGPGRRCFPSV